MLKEKTCPICGNSFTGRPNKMYCSAECRIKASGKKQNEARKKPKQKVNECKGKIKSLSLEEINCRARAEGLTYGQYMAKYYWS